MKVGLAPLYRDALLSLLRLRLLDVNLGLLLLGLLQRLRKVKLGKRLLGLLQLLKLL